ncbi:MAG: FliA/WhiG family RNA polymerase sigma factor [Terriglobia bacterium]
MQTSNVIARDEKRSRLRYRKRGANSTATKHLHSETSSRPQSVRARVAAQSCPERDQWALKLLSLVRRVAFEMRERLPQHVDVDDLAGAGVIGLLDAVRKFDARKHVKIETYARHRIRGAILDSLREMDPVSRDMRRKNKAAEKVYHNLESNLGRAVTDEEMAQALGISLKKWYASVRELNTVGSEWMRPNQIPETFVTDENNLAADDRDNPFDLCYRQEQRELINRGAAQLPERERTVLSLYYEEDMSMKQIGGMLGIDESRVSQIHSAAITRLRTKVRRTLQQGSSQFLPAFISASAPAQPVAACF